MLGAIVGDVIGSRFEAHNIKTKDFNLFSSSSRPTDDTVMTIAIAAALYNHIRYGEDLAEAAVNNMQMYGLSFSDAGYGGRFIKWLVSEDPQPYNSYGNGAGMRVSPCAILANSLEEALYFCDEVTKVTHNHPEGMKGARAITAATYLAKIGASKDEIRDHIQNNYYDLNFSLDDIREDYKFDVSCHGSVPQAIEAFLESEDFEDAIRNAISIGGDSDTIAAMSGAIAEAYYGIPLDIQLDVIDHMYDDLLGVMYDFEALCKWYTIRKE